MGLHPVTDMLRAWWRRRRAWFYRWAHREIDPLHPDVPKVVTTLNELERPMPRRRFA